MGSEELIMGDDEERKKMKEKKRKIGRAHV